MRLVVGFYLGKCTEYDSDKDRWLLPEEDEEMCAFLDRYNEEEDVMYWHQDHWSDDWCHLYLIVHKEVDPQKLDLKALMSIETYGSTKVPSCGEVELSDSLRKKFNMTCIGTYVLSNYS